MASGVLCTDFTGPRVESRAAILRLARRRAASLAAALLHASRRSVTGQRDASPLSNQFARAVRCLPKWSSGESTAGFWLSDQALDRALKGSALIKYNSTEAAVSSVNPDEQRMNRFGRETREREGERERRLWRGSPTVPGLRRVEGTREFPRSIDYHACPTRYIGQPFQSTPLRELIAKVPGRKLAGRTDAEASPFYYTGCLVTGGTSGQQPIPPLKISPKERIKFSRARPSFSRKLNLKRRSVAREFYTAMSLWILMNTVSFYLYT